MVVRYHISEANKDIYFQKTINILGMALEFKIDKHIAYTFELHGLKLYN